MDKEKAEKVAAAKNRVAALQKRKKAAGGSTGEKSSTATKAKDALRKEENEEGTEADNVLEGDEKAALPENTVMGAPETSGTESTAPNASAGVGDADEEAFDAAISAASAASPPPDTKTVAFPATISPPSADQDLSSHTKGGAQHQGRQPSVSLQSKIRSTSFRDNGPLSPAALSRDALSRVEELERENRNLSREAEEHERRWRRVEEELEELRERNAERPAGSDAESEIQRLRSEIETLRKRTSTTASVRRREISVDDLTVESLKAELEKKDSTIADMELEISRLRSQLSSQTEGCDAHGEQIAALQVSLSSAETKLRAVENELSDTKNALSKASEKALVDGTERTSKDTKLRTLERELQEATSQRDEVAKEAEQLDKKVEAMNKLHKEAEARHATRLAAAETSAREVPALRARIEKAESESARLRAKQKRVLSGDGGGEGLDELEDEERQKLERKIRDLEGEVFDLRRGVWRDKRVSMQPRGDEEELRTSLDRTGAEDFDEVDLTGSGNASSRRRSFANQQQRHSNFAQVLNSGLAAFRASTTSPSGQQTRPRNDILVQEFDDDDTFDENAFAHAQREEEARQMVEHVREVKKGLKQWAGWRLDLVEARRAGVGIGFGEIFEV